MTRASLRLLTVAMETPQIFDEVPDACGEEETSSGERGSRRSEEPTSEAGFGRDHFDEVPEYERLRQANLRKNSLKLSELGIPVLTASLNVSTTTSTISGLGTTSTVGGGGNIGNRKNLGREGAISLENCTNGLGFRNPKP